MVLKTRPCLICLKPFTPDLRTAKHQRVCCDEACQKERKRRKWRRWAARHKEQRKGKLRLWAEAYPYFWRHYRQENEDYRKKDNKRRCRAAKRARRSAKQTLIWVQRAEGIGRLEDLAAQIQRSAKQTLIARGFLEVAGCLRLGVPSAKQPHIVSAGVSDG